MGLLEGDKMEIGPVENNKPVRPEEVPANRKPETGTQREDIVDRVEVSKTARARLAELADQRLRAEQKQVELTSEENQDRLETIRKRIETGFYNRPEIRTQVVDKLIDDLDE